MLFRSLDAGKEKSDYLDTVHTSEIYDDAGLSGHPHLPAIPEADYIVLFAYD